MRDPLVRSFGKDVEYLRVSPLSDVHIGSPQFDLAAFKKFIAAVQEDPNWYLAGNGDYIENVTRSSIGDVWEQTMPPAEQIREVAKILEPVKGRILCFTDGNHEDRSKKETSFEPARMLCEKLGLPENLYQPEGAALVLRFGHRSDEGVKIPQVYTFYVTHGKTGGRLPGAKMIAVDRISRTFEGFDVVLMGHVHDMMSRKIPVYALDRNNYKIHDREQAQVVAGSFLTYGGYGQKAGYMPGAVGMPSVVLGGRQRSIEIRM
ncbi:MAG: metallophosphoesterase family protein [Acidobacteriaceae bacterium]